MNLEQPHRRFNPLTGEWVLVSPHRARRPWLGQVERLPAEQLPAYDQECYLCPGNRRAGDRVNPPYTSTFVFDNDFPAILSSREIDSQNTLNARTAGAGTIPAVYPAALPGLFTAEPESGLCRVVCFSPRHDLTLPELSQAQVEAVVRTWRDQTQELAGLDFIAYVQVFENKGEMMGCSNPHPHSQIWATSSIPNEPAKELANLAAYHQQRNSCLLCDVLAIERESGERLVTANEHFTAVVPFWAVWPFEILLLPHRHVGSLMDLQAGEVAALADVIRRVTARYDNLFEISFPYSMGFHQAPAAAHFPPGLQPGWHLHAHYYPPLLRSATVRKFMVGFEMLGMPQRDLTPETAAARLRSLDERHYRSR